jgi:hypothetical protein
VEKASPTPFDADFTIASLSTDQQPAADLAPRLTARSGWRPVLGVPSPGQPPQATVSVSPAGLRIKAINFPGDLSSPAVAPADTPDPLPAIVARDAPTSVAPGYPGTVQGIGLDGRPLLLRVAGVAAVLPRSLTDGVLVDLGQAAAVSDPAGRRVTSEVWLAPGAEAAVRDRLAAAGVRVTGREDLSARVRSLSRDTPARAADVSLAVAGAALALILVVLASNRVIDADRRRALWTVGRLSGLPRARLARIVAAEIAAPALVATVIGALAGLLSIGLAGVRLPLFAAGTAGPPLDVRPGLTAVAAVVAGLLVLVVLIAVTSAAAEAAQARRSRR